MIAHFASKNKVRAVYSSHLHRSSSHNQAIRINLVWDELHFMREDTFERKQAQSWGQYHSAKMPKFLWHFQKCSVLQKLLRLVAKLVEWSRISQQFIAVLGSNPAYI